MGDLKSQLVQYVMDNKSDFVIPLPEGVVLGFGNEVPPIREMFLFEDVYIRFFFRESINGFLRGDTQKILPAVNKCNEKITQLMILEYQQMYLAMRIQGFQHNDIMESHRFFNLSDPIQLNQDYFNFITLPDAPLPAEHVIDNNPQQLFDAVNTMQVLVMWKICMYTVSWYIFGIEEKNAYAAVPEFLDVFCELFLEEYKKAFSIFKERN